MKPSILFLTTSSNWPLTDGKRQRTWFLIEALSKKFNVDVLLIAFSSDKKQVEESKSSIRNFYFINVIDSKFLQPGYPNFLLSKKQKVQKDFFLNECDKLFTRLNFENNYQFVFSRYLQPLFIFPFRSEIEIVCDVDDVYFETQKSRIKNESSWIRKIKLNFLYFLGSQKVIKVINRIGTFIVVKKTDESFFKQKNTVCIPNLPFGYYLEQQENNMQNANSAISNDLNFGFIGKLSYRPNYQGLIQFINSVWNPLMENGFDAKFVIAGSGDIPKELKLAITSSKNIDFLGFVENSNQFWSKITVLVVPVAEGGGSNIKISEALMYGKCVIAHSFAVRGYENFSNKNYFLIANNDQDWIELLKNFDKNNLESKETIIHQANEIFNLEKWNQSLLSAVENANIKN